MLNLLSKGNTFSRREYYDAYKEQFGVKNTYAIDYSLRKALAGGVIVHIGRDQYVTGKTKRTYTYNYSETARSVATMIKEEYPLVDFRIFEMVQLNAFVNHLFAHNTIFVSVEGEVIDFVFDSLRNVYPGRVMLKPRLAEYYRYMVDDQIVVLRLPSESPKGTEEVWHSRLEKILVDLSVDKLLGKLVSQSEYNRIYTEAFERYLIDEKAMFRYAKRKGAGEKYKKSLVEYLNQTEED